jgi:hypothetical protein
VKGSWKLRSRGALSRSDAWACFTANLALPGSGSLAAGRAVGYGQMAVSFLGLILSLVTAIPMFQWALSGGLAASQSPLEDPFQGLSELWLHVRWPLAGIGLVAAALLWALTTSLAILAAAPKNDLKIPPPINPPA